MRSSCCGLTADRDHNRSRIVCGRDPSQNLSVADHARPLVWQTRCHPRSPSRVSSNPRRIKSTQAVEQRTHSVRLRSDSNHVSGSCSRVAIGSKNATFALWARFMCLSCKLCGQCARGVPNQRSHSKDLNQLAAFLPLRSFSARPRRLSAGLCDTCALLWFMGRACVPLRWDVGQ